MYNQIKIIRELVDNNQTWQILEIGPGNNDLSNYLKYRDYKLTTCDINSEYGPDVVGDILELPFKDKQFEIITAFQVIEHINWKDIERALKEMKRVSKEWVIISVPYSAFFFQRQ
jgi:SAM-dependent methyltransferase